MTSKKIIHGKGLLLFIAALVLIMNICSCVDEYKYLKDDVPHFLMVQGYVSDNIGDSHVQLAWTGQLNRPMDYIDNAKVWVKSSSGAETPFHLTQDGKYLPDDPNFIADIAHVYRLYFEVDGNQYQSDELRIPKTLELQKVGWNPTRFDTISTSLDGLFLTIKATTNDDASATKFYRYDIDQTYMIETIMYGETIYDIKRIDYTRPMYMISGYFYCPSDANMSRELYDVASPEMIKEGKVTRQMIQDDRRNIFRCPYGSLRDGQVFLDNVQLVEMEAEETVNDAPRYCWSNEYYTDAAEIAIEGRNQAVISNEPVYYIKLRYNFGIRYSALVKQYALPEGYYTFKELSKKFSIGEQSLYHVQPGYVKGNIHSVSNPDEKVIGYFYATAVRKKRIFIDRQELPEPEQLELQFYYPRYTTNIDEIPGIDTLDARWVEYKQESPEDAAYVLNKILKARSDALKNFFRMRGTSKVSNMQEICKEAKCANWGGKLFSNPSWLFDCRYYGSCQRPAFWVDYDTTITAPDCNCSPGLNKRNN